jgi:hypothetical protein
MLSWFDLAAIQEVNDNLAGLRALQDELPKRFRVVFSDGAGNNERMTFLYDSRRVELLEEVGEIGFTASERRRVTQSTLGGPFESFDRTPHLGTFQAGQLRFGLVNVHLYWGDERDPKKLAVRAAEAYAVGWWTEHRSRQTHVYIDDVYAVGDFNIPKALPSDRIFAALTAKGLRVPKDAETRIATSLGGKQFDQVAFLPGSADKIIDSGVFDFDTALFRTLTDSQRKPLLRRMSDHRPLWFVLTTSGPQPGPRAISPPRPGIVAGLRPTERIPWGTLVPPRLA